MSFDAKPNDSHLRVELSLACDCFAGVGGRAMTQSVMHGLRLRNLQDTCSGSVLAWCCEILSFPGARSGQLASRDARAPV